MGCLERQVDEMLATSIVIAAVEVVAVVAVVAVVVVGLS